MKFRPAPRHKWVFSGGTTFNQINHDAYTKTNRGPFSNVNRLLGRFSWPRKHEIAAVKDGYVYTIETDEERELEEVVRYKVDM